MGHYETLKVMPSASHEEIRRAYHTEARRWHPDRYNDSDAATAAEAEDSMRRVNEAWRVLGDSNRRLRYDHEQTAATGSAEAEWPGVRVDDQITRIDPRLLDREFLRSRSEARFEEVDNKRTVVLRIAPWLALLGLVFGIFIFTAYQGDSRPATVATTVPGPAIGVPANACVRVIGGPQLLEVPCDGLYDGRVLAAAEPGSKCPSSRDVIREVVLSNDVVVCLGP